jgi:eukaryotic-like serine/threonine-protein kinase
MPDEVKFCSRCQAACDIEDSFCQNCGLKFREVQPGDWFFNNKYQLIEMIGEGGMGSVWKAKRVINSDNMRVVDSAVKFLHRHYSEGRPDVVRMFEDEAVILAELKNSHIVPLFEYGNDPQTGLFFIGMDLVLGGTLEDEVNKKKVYQNEIKSGKDERQRTVQEDPLPLTRIVDIMHQILDAMGSVHDKKIYHRDLKPSNLMLESEGGGSERVYVLDFGIARFLEAEKKGEGRTSIHSIMGSYPYMSPEHFNGEQYDGRSDIFALGIIMYEMLTGNKPFGGDQNEMATTIMNRIENHPHPDAGSMMIAPTKELASPIAKVLNKAMAKKPQDRYQTCADFRGEIDDLITPSGIPVWILFLLGVIVALGVGFVSVKMIIE